MADYLVFHRKNMIVLEYIEMICAENHADAIKRWDSMYGGNYGKVVIIPRRDFDGAESHIVLAKGA